MTQITSVLALLIAALAVLSVSAPVSVRAQGAGTQITISQPAEATTMDPGRSTQVLTVNYFYNLYDTLTRWDTALKLQPGLATAWKSVNETTWEFTLRQGVKFHDGAPLTAEDVKATLERNLVPGKTIVQSGFATIEAVQVVNPAHDAHDHQEARPPAAGAHGPDGRPDPPRAAHHRRGREGAGPQAGRHRRLPLRRVGEGRAARHGGQPRLVGLGGQAAGDRPRGLEADPRRLPPPRRAREGRGRHHHQRAARPDQGHRRAAGSRAW